MSAKWKSHSDNKGFLKMSKHWNNKGVPKKKLAQGAKKTKIPTDGALTNFGKRTKKKTMRANPYLG